MSKRFQITMEVDVDLTLEQLWPDGDAPESPTEGDVVNLINGCGGPARVLRDWNLDESLVCDVRELK